MHHINVLWWSSKYSIIIWDNYYFWIFYHYGPSSFVFIVRPTKYFQIVNQVFASFSEKVVSFKTFKTTYVYFLGNPIFRGVSIFCVNEGVSNIFRQKWKILSSTKLNAFTLIQVTPSSSVLLFASVCCKEIWRMYLKGKWHSNMVSVKWESNNTIQLII